MHLPPPQQEATACRAAFHLSPCCFTTSRRDHSYFRNQAAWLRQQGVFQCPLEYSFQICLVKRNTVATLFRLQSYRPRRGSAPRPSCSCPLRVTAFSNLLPSGRGRRPWTYLPFSHWALPCPHTPSASLQYCLQLLFYRTTCPNFLNITIIEPNYFPDEENIFKRVPDASDC